MTMKKALAKVGTIGTAVMLLPAAAMAQEVSNSMDAVETAVNTNTGLALGAVTGVAAALIGLAFVTGIIKTAIGWGKAKK